jgi:hypothetical protein
MNALLPRLDDCTHRLSSAAAFIMVFTVPSTTDEFFIAQVVFDDN